MMFCSVSASILKYAQSMCPVVVVSVSWCERVFQISGRSSSQAPHTALLPSSAVSSIAAGAVAGVGRSRARSADWDFLPAAQPRASLWK